MIPPCAIQMGILLWGDTDIESPVAYNLIAGNCIYWLEIVLAGKGMFFLPVYGRVLFPLL